MKDPLSRWTEKTGQLCLFQTPENPTKFRRVSHHKLASDLPARLYNSVRYQPLIDFFATFRSALFATQLFRTILNMSICPGKIFEASGIVIACAEIFAIQVNFLV